jgi:DNA-binding NarL/FixJ family response regulator
MISYAKASFRQNTEGEGDKAGATPRLTSRQQQVFELIGKGKTTKEIAELLKLSTATIGNHRKAISRKLGTHSTAELVSRAAVGDR